MRPGHAVGFGFLGGIAFGGEGDLSGIAGLPGERLGYATVAIGDLDGDAVADVVTANPYHDGQRGLAVVFSGGSGARLYELHGTQGQEWFGVSLAALDDVDGDGADDFAVGASEYNPPQESDSGPPSSWQPGFVSIRSGANGQEIRRLTGEHAGDLFGSALTRISDRDGDQLADIAVGAPYWDPSPAANTDAGRVYVFSTATGALLRQHTGGSVERFGTAVGAAGDLDGDGCEDLVVGVPNYPSSGSGVPGHLVGSGAIRVFSGKSGQLLLETIGEKGQDGLGTHIGSGGDVDNDGTIEFLAAAPGFPQGIGNGRVYAHDGAAAPYPLVTGIDAEQAGIALAGVGDWNGDGHDDLAVGSRAYGHGRLRIVSGAGGDVLFGHDGCAGDEYARSLAGGGGGHGIGEPKVLVGIPGGGAAGSDTGHIEIIAAAACAGQIEYLLPPCQTEAAASPLHMDVAGCAEPGKQLSVQAATPGPSSPVWLFVGLAPYAPAPEVTDNPAGAACSLASLSWQNVIVLNATGMLALELPPELQPGDLYVQAVDVTQSGGTRASELGRVAIRSPILQQP